MKPGYKTTEFWMTALAAAVGLLMTSDLFVADSIWAKGLGLVAAGLASAGYAVSRGMAKRGGE
jgi:hypothetical protein